MWGKIRSLERQEKLKREHAAYIQGQPIKASSKEMKWSGISAILWPSATIILLGLLALAGDWNFMLVMAVAGLILISLWAVYEYVRNRNVYIVFEEEGFIYRDIWRNAHSVLYKSITKCERYEWEYLQIRKWGITVYTEARNYKFTSDLIGLAYLCEQIIKHVGRDENV